MADKRCRLMSIKSYIIIEFFFFTEQMRWGLGFREHRYFALEEKKYLVRKCNFTKSCAHW